MTLSTNARIAGVTFWIYFAGEIYFAVGTRARFEISLEINPKGYAL